MFGLLADHLGAAIRANHVNAALADNMWNLLAAFWADAVAPRTRTGLVPATPAPSKAGSPAAAASLALATSLAPALAKSIA
jgi:hypothetical protein